jgi:hypothetical protein
MVFGFRDLRENGLELLIGGARGKDVAFRMTGREAREDLRHLSSRFALAEDDFGHSVAQFAMMVELGEAEVFKGKMAKARKSFVGRELSGTDVTEQFAEQG